MYLQTTKVSAELRHYANTAVVLPELSKDQSTIATPGAPVKETGQKSALLRHSLSFPTISFPHLNSFLRVNKEWGRLALSAKPALPLPQTGHIWASL